ncbi:MAG: N-acetyltransferase [Chloroflexi bacterium]|nr:MAG: N-acetyltransferase [Chloroflexota bacterium]
MTEIKIQSDLLTERLLLRSFLLTDAPRVQKLAGDRAVAEGTFNIPYPYENGMAEAWIRSHQPAFESGNSVTYAITLRPTGELLGAIGLSIKELHQRAELGYWVGVPYWGNGYCSEAARALLAYGFHQLQSNRIYAEHFASNPASGRVMQKIGMTYEGTLRQHMRKWEQFEDMRVYSILQEEFTE